MDNSKLQSDQITLSEHLSALLDDEAGGFEQRRVLDELKTDDSLSQKLSSYALIGESMRSNKVHLTGSSFLAGIHREINEESEYHHVELKDEDSQSTKPNSWLRPVGGFAMAASVAAIAVLGFQNYQQKSLLVEQQSNLVSAQTELSKPKQQLSVAEMKSATVVSATDLVAANDEKASIVYQQADASTRSYLKRYVDSHMQYASRTFVPSVRVIAYADY